MNVIQEIASSVQSDTDTSSCTFGPDELLIQTPSPNPETNKKVNSSRSSNLALPQQYIPTEPTGRTTERRVTGQYIDSDNPSGGGSVSEQYIGSGTPDRTTERRASLTDRVGIISKAWTKINWKNNLRSVIKITVLYVFSYEQLYKKTFYHT